LNIRRITTDITSNIKMLWRNKGNLFWALAFPVLLMVIFGSIFSVGQNQPLTLYVQDNDNSPLSNLFNSTLNGTGAFVIRTVPSGLTGEQLNTTINDKEIHRLLIIPSGFNETFNQTGIANLTLLLDQGDQQASAQTYQIVRSVAYELSLRISGSAGGINVPYGQFLPAQEEFRYIDFFLPGIIGMTIMTSGVYGAIAVNTRYRKNGILRKVATTPMTKAEWVISKVSYQIFLAFLSMAALLTVAMLAYGVRIHLNALVFLLIITGSMTFSGLGMIVARFVKDEEAAESAGAAINFPMMFLSGIFFPLEMMPSYLQAIGKVMPLYYLGEGLRDAMISVDMTAALLNASIILILGVVIVAIGSVVSAWTDE
jgi:ABC-2 type transport system permease protein